MRKILLTVAIVVLFLMQALPSLAEYDFGQNISAFYLCNESDSKTIVMNVVGKENTDFNKTVTAGPGECSSTSEKCTAWFLSATNFRWTVTVSSQDGSSASGSEKMAEIELFGQNMYILWPNWLQYYVSDQTVYTGTVDSSATIESLLVWGDFLVSAK